MRPNKLRAVALFIYRPLPASWGFGFFRKRTFTPPPPTLTCCTGCCQKPSVDMGVGASDG
jgi:hypothetical protein